MSNAKFKAVDDIRKLGRSLSGLIELANELEHVASLEQAAMDTKARVEKLRADEEAASLKYAEAKAKSEAQQAMADEVMVDAKATADQILDKANAKAAEIVSQAHTKAYEKQAAGEALRAKALSDAQVIEAEIAVMKKEKDELDQIVKGLKAELEALKKRIG
jgi:chromosome segregation ATPase